MILTVSVLIGLAIAARFARADSGRFGSFGQLFWRYAAIGIAASVFLGGVISGITYDATRDEESRRFELTSLGDGVGVEGRFFLGSGTVESKPVFFYYAPRSSGGYGLFHQDANISHIYEDTTSGGYMLKFCKDNTSGSKWATMPFFDFYSADDEDRYDCSVRSVERVEFHVPANSIDRNFQLDAE